MSLTDDIQFVGDQQISVSEITAELVKLGIINRVPEIELSVTHDPRDYMRQIIIRMARKLAYIPGQEKVVIPRIEVPEIRVPATWWDAFKAQHFDVLLRWLPVRYRTLQRHEVVQFEQEYQARWYLPNFDIPESYAGPVKIQLFEGLTYQ